MRESINLPGELCDDPREQDENEDALRFVEENCTVPDFVILPNTGQRCFLRDAILKTVCVTARKRSEKP